MNQLQRTKDASNYPTHKRKYLHYGSPWLRIGRIVHTVAEIFKEKQLETNLIKKSITKAREIISMVKSTYCFCREPEFSFRTLEGGSQPPITLAPVEPDTSGLQRHLHSHAQTHRD